MKDKVQIQQQEGDNKNHRGNKEVKKIEKKINEIKADSLKR